MKEIIDTVLVGIDNTFQKRNMTKQSIENVINAGGLYNALQHGIQMDLVEGQTCPLKPFVDALVPMPLYEEPNSQN